MKLKAWISGLLIAALVGVGFPAAAQGNSETRLEEALKDTDAFVQIVEDAAMVSANDETTAAGDAGDVSYRALIIGNTYPGTDDELHGPDTDAAGIAAMLNRQAGTPYEVSVKTNQTAEQMLGAIESAFEGADSNDVSLFYYSGHGIQTGALCGVENTYVTVTELRQKLGNISGIKIVLLDCCYSGMLIGKSVDGTTAFNDAVISAFASKTRDTLSGGNYLVLTACSQSETSYGLWNESTGRGYSFFTCGIARGSGYDVVSCTNCDMNADIQGDNNGASSLGEVYDYAAGVVQELAADLELSQNMQYYGDLNAVLWAHDENYVPDDTDGSDEEPINADYEYEIADGKATLLQYVGSDTAVVVPSKINGYPVRKVGYACFLENQSIETLAISEGIEEIEANFVQNCNNLKSIHVPATAKLITSYAHYGISGFVSGCAALEIIDVADGNPYFCVLENILYDENMTQILCYPAQIRNSVYRMPEGIVTIPSDAFAGNLYLQEVILPDSIKIIGYWAFAGCQSLEKINIPENCQHIGQYAFQLTKISEIHLPASTQFVPPALPPMLRTITVDEENPYYYAVDNVLFSRSGSLDYYSPLKPDETYTVPEGITSIATMAFARSDNLKKVILPEGITRIERYAFFESGLYEIAIPETVTALEPGTFFSCNSLAKLVIPASVTTFGASLLSNVEGTVIYGEEGSAAQSWAAENGYVFRNMNAEWDKSGTYGDNIEWYLSEDGVLTIDGAGAMENLAQVPWSDSASMIRTVVFSDDITSVAQNAFESCQNLTSVSLPENLISIGNSAFIGCSSLTEIKLPDQLQSIGNCAFLGCIKLATIDLPDSLSKIGSDAFYNCRSIVSIVIPDGITGITSNTFSFCDNLENVVLPESITELESGAFHGCIKLQSIHLPDGIAYIGSYAFRHCDSLTEIVIPKKISIIRNNSFSECSKLIHVSIPEGVKSIEEDAFYNCSSLTSITIPDSVTTIGKNAFNNCTNLDSVFFAGDDAPSIDLTAFPATTVIVCRKASAVESWAIANGYAVQIISELNLSASLTIIDAEAFRGLNVEKVILPQNVTSVGSRAFADCVKLKLLVIHADSIAIAEDAFDGCGDITIVSPAESDAREWAERHNMSWQQLQ